MSWLARLKNQKAPDAHATKPTKPHENGGKGGFVGFVACPPAPFEKFKGTEPAANEPMTTPPPGDFGLSADPIPLRLAGMKWGEGFNPFDACKDPAPDPDRHCWPHSTAMNTAELDTMTARLARFTDKGMGLIEAERLADKLVLRDREGDDRRLCLECSHLQGHGRWRCGNWQAANVAPQGLAPDLVVMLQRCAGFKSAVPHSDAQAGDRPDRIHHTPGQTP